MRFLALTFEWMLSLVCAGFGTLFVGSSLLMFFGSLLTPDFRRHWTMIPFALIAAGLYFAFGYCFLLSARKGAKTAEAISAGTSGPSAVLDFAGDSPLWGGIVSCGFICMAVLAGQMRGRVIERARLTEAQTMASQIRQAQERYLVRYGRYLTSNEQLSALDISFAGAAPSFGMRNFVLTASAATTCGQGYGLRFSRCEGSKGPQGCAATAARPHPHYGAYSMSYDRCSDRYSYGSCRNCEVDFGQ